MLGRLRFSNKTRFCMQLGSIDAPQTFACMCPLCQPLVDSLEISWAVDPNLTLFANLYVLYRTNMTSQKHTLGSDWKLLLWGSPRDLSQTYAPSTRNWLSSVFVSGSSHTATHSPLRHHLAELIHLIVKRACTKSKHCQRSIHPVLLQTITLRVPL